MDLTGSDNENSVNVSNVLDAEDNDTAGAEGTFGSWTVDNGEGNDTVVGSAGVDTITTNDGGDSITGGAGNDVISSGAGADSVAGGAGNDNITVADGADTVAGGAGADAIDLLSLCLLRTVSILPQMLKQKPLTPVLLQRRPASLIWLRIQ